MPPKTVLYLTPSVRLLGARQSLLALVRSLDPQRYRAVVCCQSKGGLTEELERSGIPVVILHTGWWRKTKYWLKRPFVLWRLRNLIRREGAALIHCNEIYPNPFAVTVGRWTSTPVITHMRLSVTPSMTSKYLLHRAERIVVVSEAAGHDFDHWPDKSSKVEVIYNGVDPQKYQLPETKEQLRREMNCPRDAFIIGQVATWAHRKRQHIAVEALALLAEKYPQLRLVLVGGAARTQQDYEAELRSLIAARQLHERVMLLPFTNQIASIYNAIDVNLLISGDEGFGRTIIEAGSVGVPTIGAQAGGIPEIIRNGETGWLVPVDEPQALADVITDLVEQPEKVKTAGEAARQMVNSRFTIEKHTQHVMDLYDRVLKKQAGGK